MVSPEQVSEERVQLAKQVLLSRVRAAESKVRHSRRQTRNEGHRLARETDGWLRLLERHADCADLPCRELRIILDAVLGAAE